MCGISLNSESLQDSFFVFVQTFLVTEKHTNRNNAAAVEMQPCKNQEKAIIFIKHSNIHQRVRCRDSS